MHTRSSKFLARVTSQKNHFSAAGTMGHATQIPLLEEKFALSPYLNIPAQFTILQYRHPLPQAPSLFWPFSTCETRGVAVCLSSKAYPLADPSCLKIFEVLHGKKYGRFVGSVVKI